MRHPSHDGAVHAHSAPIPATSSTARPQEINMRTSVFVTLLLSALAIMSPVEATATPITVVDQTNPDASIEVGAGAGVSGGQGFVPHVDRARCGGVDPGAVFQHAYGNLSERALRDA